MSKQNKVLIACGTVLVIIIVILLVIVFTKKEEPVITYSVTFNSNGGSIVREQLVNAGEKAIKPLDPTKEGYMFVEWRHNNKKFDFNMIIEQNIILKAIWRKILEDVEMVTVKFETDGGTTISNQIIEKNGKAIKPEEPTKEGHIFKGWYLEETEYNFDETVTENIEINAKWEKIEEKPKEEKPKEEKPKEEKPKEEKPKEEKPKEEKPTEEKPTVKKYTITFNSNGGSSIDSQTVEEGEKATAPSLPTRTGYEFVGWTLNGNTYDFDTIVNSNITLIANWKEIVKNNYTVTFNSNGGTPISSQTVTEGNKVTKPQNPTKEGYTFNGWILNGSNYNFDNTVNRNITLIANWTQNNYIIKSTKVDAYSPDTKLNVYENGTLITIKSIKYSNGILLCNGTNTTVATLDIEGETSFIVVLNSGTEVIATLQ